MSYASWLFGNTFFRRTHSFVRMKTICRTAVFTVEAAFDYLGLPVNSSVDDCRNAYLKLARRLHPDVKSSYKTSDECAPFQRLQTAYKIATEAAKSKASRSESDHRTGSFETLIRHRAPQHRHYLEAESRLGNSIPLAGGLCSSDRYRQVQSRRFAEAVYASADYRVARILAEVTTEKLPSVQPDIIDGEQNGFKSVNFIERVADDIIEEAMDRGDFDHLSGQGKPLPKEEVAVELFGDPTKIKITRILCNQGYLPEWIQMNKELRERWEKAVTKVVRFCASYPVDQKRVAAIEEFREEVVQINRLIDRYNLVVPSLHLQRVHKNPDKVIREMLHTNAENPKEQTSSDPASSSRTPEQPKQPSSRSQRPGPEELRSKQDNDGNLFDARYLAEIMRDFYRELARAYSSMMRGFKDHK